MPQKTLDEYLKSWQTQTVEKQHQSQQKREETKYGIVGFYRETQFQDTEIGKIPKEWKLTKLSFIVDKIKGRKPENLCEDVTNDCLPYLEAQVLRGLEKPKYVKQGEGVIVEPGDIAMIWDGSYAGEAFLVKERGVLASTMVKLTSKTSEINLIYLYYWLLHRGTPLRKQRKGTGIPHVSEQVFSNLPVVLPPLQEQWGIAEVLSSVDQAIEATDRLIQKLEHVKKALTQELLTKGIGHKEYQETSIGKIPKEWDITILGKVASINEKPINIKNIKGLVARIPMELIPDDGIYARYELVDFNNVKSYVIANAGDILLAKITPSFENGKQGIVPEDVPNGVAFTTTEVYPITPQRIDRMFLFYLLKWKRYRKLLEYKMTGTTGRRRVPRKALENLLIPLPPLEEQKRIASILSAVDEWIELERTRKEKLESLKRSLMDLLLSGVVRVEVAKLDSNT